MFKQSAFEAMRKKETRNMRDSPVEECEVASHIET